LTCLLQTTVTLEPTGSSNVVTLTLPANVGAVSELQLVANNLGEDQDAPFSRDIPADLKVCSKPTTTTKGMNTESY
jgi:hypothetical protein